jgi:hypothetical protein
MVDGGGLDILAHRVGHDLQCGMYLSQTMNLVGVCDPF